jgi:hypothetical protein
MKRCTLKVDVQLADITFLILTRNSASKSNEKNEPFIQAQHLRSDIFFGLQKNQK